MPPSTSSSTTMSIIFVVLLIAMLVAELASADVCQCGSRCSVYKREHHCTRCCTSVMRRRSVPFLDYPREQINTLRESAKLDTDAPISEQLLAQIVEQTAAQQKRQTTRLRPVRVVAPVDAVEVASRQQQKHVKTRWHHQKGAAELTQRKQQQQQRRRREQQETQLWRRVLSSRRRRNDVKSQTSTSFD